MRLTPSQLPRAAPWVSTASRKYREQLGSNRQPDPGPPSQSKNGDTVHW